MTDIPAHPTQLNIETLRKVVKLVAKEAREAQAILDEATAQKTAINKIPQRKAGGGKEAKRAANKKFLQARSNVNQLTLSLKNANADLENALMATVMNGNNNGNGNGEDDLGKEVVNLAGRKSEPIVSVYQEQDISHKLDETPPNTLIAKGGSSSDEPSDGSNKQGSGLADVEMPELQTQGYHATPESNLSGVIPRDQDTLHFANMLSNHTAAAEIPTESTKPFDKVEKSHENKQHASSEEVPGKRSRERDTGTLDPPERKKQVPVTSTRESRSTSSKKARLADRGSEKRVCAVEDDEWVTLSDPPSDTDEKEGERVLEGKKSKHVGLNGEEKRMYRFMTQGDQEAYDKKARTAIEKYLQAGKPIDRGICRMARLDPAFLPEAATTTQKLALHCLTSKEGNIMCGFADYMEPRQRSFTFQAIRFMVPNLSLGDFYTHGEALDNGVIVAKKRVHYWVKTLNDRIRAATTSEGGYVVMQKESSELPEAMDM